MSKPKFTILAVILGNLVLGAYLIGLGQFRIPTNNWMAFMDEQMALFLD